MCVMQKAFVNNKNLYILTLKFSSVVIDQARARNYRRSMAKLGFQSSQPRSIIIYCARLKTLFIFLSNLHPQFGQLNSRRHYALIDVEFMLMSASVYPHDRQLSLFVCASHIKAG